MFHIVHFKKQYADDVFRITALCARVHHFVDKWHCIFRHFALRTTMAAPCSLNIQRMDVYVLLSWMLPFYVYLKGSGIAFSVP